MRKIINIFLAILLLAVLLGVIGFILYFTNGGTSEFKSFYLVVNGKNVLNDTGGYTVAPGYSLDVEVKYTFGLFNDSLSEYSVELYTKTDNDFTFKRSDEDVKWSSISGDELAKALKFEMTDYGFIVSSDCNDMQSVLEKIYPEDKIVVDEDNIPKYNDLVELHVYSYNKASVVKLSFAVCVKVPIGSVTVPNDSFIFGGIA